MNRQLKFRAWDKLAKQFTYPDKGYQGHYVLTLNGRFQNLQNGSGGDEYIVQQFTGFKDIDMKEIYEGDNIEFQTDNKNYRGLIAWTLGAYNVLANTLDEEKIPTRIWFKDLYGDIFNYKVRVIGNSYENPELLKQ